MEWIPSGKDHPTGTPVRSGAGWVAASGLGRVDGGTAAMDGPGAAGAAGGVTNVVGAAGGGGIERGPPLREIQTVTAITPQTSRSHAHHQPPVVRETAASTGSVAETAGGFTVRLAIRCGVRAAAFLD